MTARRRDGQEPTPFHSWVRGHPSLDSVRECLCIGDSDLWVQKYGQRDTRHGTQREVQYLMLVEAKTHGRDMDDPQRDLLSAVNQLLRTKALREQRSAGAFVTGHLQNVRRVYSFIAGKVVQIHCYGVHKLRMSGASPELSQWMTWSDGQGQERYVSCDELVRLFRFDISPDTLRPLEHREHKRRVEAPASLFDEAS